MLSEVALVTQKVAFHRRGRGQNSHWPSVVPWVEYLAWSGSVGVSGQVQRPSCGARLGGPDTAPERRRQRCRSSHSAERVGERWADVSWLGTQKGQGCHNNIILSAVRVLGGGDN